MPRKPPDAPPDPDLTHASLRDFLAAVATRPAPGYTPHRRRPNGYKPRPAGLLPPPSPERVRDVLLPRMLAAPRCVWCKAAAMRDRPWCAAHKPGPRKRPPPPGTPPPNQRVNIWHSIQERAALEMAPLRLRAWPPFGRVMLVKPVRRDPGLRHIVSAFMADAAGDVSAWPDLLASLRQAGFLSAADPDHPWVSGRSAAAGLLDLLDIPDIAPDTLDIVPDTPGA